ncbi:MAG TPA: ferredoxin family protein [Candidatus Aquabacterium excrementipullorum]|nr:ferredoxin family protein [Candidatus Aquabacterium excrementipullorum]
MSRTIPISAGHFTPRTIAQFSDAPVTVDEELCIAHKGCTVCVDVCPMDLLAIDESSGKAFMKYDECWYCLPCEKDCPTGAIKVAIPYLLR